MVFWQRLAFEELEITWSAAATLVLFLNEVSACVSGVPVCGQISCL
jgi:hypothetical protein